MAGGDRGAGGRVIGMKEGTSDDMTPTSTSTSTSSASASCHAPTGSDGLGMTSGRSSSPGPGGNPVMINPCLLLLSILYVTFMAIAVVSAPSALRTALFLLIGLLPVLLIARLVRVHLHSEEVPWQFLFNQFVLSAIPGTFAVLILELLVMALLLVIVLGSERSAIRDALQQAQQDGEGKKTSMEAILKILPLWKLLTLAFGMAFLVAAVVEEGMKWACARRAARFRTVYGYLSSSCVCGLGLAMVENNAFVFGLSSRGVGVGGARMGVWLVVLRDMFAFPVHVGTTLFVGIAAAAARLDAEGDAGKWNVVRAWVAAVGFHGAFDAVSLVATVLVAKGVAPSGVEVAVVAVQTVGVVGFSVLLRARYRALVEREHAVGGGSGSLGIGGGGWAEAQGEGEV